MANIASGWITISPASKLFYDDIQERLMQLPGTFGYGEISGEPDISYQDLKIEINFSSRWECNGAWDYFDELLENFEYFFRDEIINSRIDGRGWESGGGYYEGVRKLPGELVLKRRRK